MELKKFSLNMPFCTVPGGYLDVLCENAQVKINWGISSFFIHMAGLHWITSHENCMASRFVRIPAYSMFMKNWCLNPMKFMNFIWMIYAYLMKIFISRKGDFEDLLPCNPLIVIQAIRALWKEKLWRYLVNKKTIREFSWRALFFDTVFEYIMELVKITFLESFNNQKFLFKSLKSFYVNLLHLFFIHQRPHL